MIKKLLSVVSTIALALTFGIQAASAGGNDRLMKVLNRGKIVIGVKADYKPWGFRDTSGKLVGMEIDMAQDVADALGVELELVPVQSSNRMQFVQQGKIDMMIATMSDKADRRKVVGIIDPNYYTSGTNVLASKKAGLKKWEDLRGKPVCVRRLIHHGGSRFRRVGRLRDADDDRGRYALGPRGAVGRARQALRAFHGRHDL
jgi:polar amino acid transport system substrate-binding protein